MTTLALPVSGGDERQVAVAVNRLLDGKINATGQVTLDAGQTSTLLLDRRIGIGSVIVFSALSASAAASAAAGLWISGRGAGVATVNHVADTATDQTFAYAVLG